MTGITLLHGDCRELLSARAEGEFDLCLADPPYGDTSLRWDQIVPGWIPAVARVLKPDASIWVFGSLRFLATLMAEMESHGFKYSQDVIWEKQNGTGFQNDRFNRVHEFVVLFYRGAWANVHHEPQFTNDATARTIRRKTRPTHMGDIGAGHYVSEDGGPRLMRSVIYQRNEHGRAIHPTQKPVELIQPLVRYSCPPGGSVVVPFAGSGSELIAARTEGRSGFGCEKDATHYRDACERIANDAPLFALEAA